MRVVVLGGTRFIGRTIVDELIGAGHQVLIVHRGQSEPGDLPDATHVHADLRELGSGDAKEEVARFDAEALVHCMALGAADTDAVLGAFPDQGLRLLVLSSMDVYRAYGGLHSGQATDAVPVDETSPVREQRYPYRGQMPGMDDYEKLDVEERWVARGGTVLRLPMVYGPHDYQRREWFVLRRVHAGRTRIPIGTGNGLFTRGYVGDVARGVRLAMERDDVGGEIFNLGETRTPTSELLARSILAAAGSDAELVRVPDDALPPDLSLTGAIRQHLLVDSSKARRILGWQDSDPRTALTETVRWHLENPPTGDDPGFEADDQALAAAASASTGSESDETGGTTSA